VVGLVTLGGRLRVDRSGRQVAERALATEPSCGVCLVSTTREAEARRLVAGLRRAGGLERRFTSTGGGGPVARRVGRAHAIRPAFVLGNVSAAPNRT